MSIFNVHLGSGKFCTFWIVEISARYFEFFLAEIPKNLKSILQGPFVGLIIEDRFPTLDGFDGTPNIEESYLLLSRYDGDLQEGVVELVDLRTFEILHTWNPNIDAFNDLIEQVDEFKYLNRDFNNGRFILRHPLITSDNGLIFKMFTPLYEINSCSNLLRKNTRDKFHHSIETDIDGNIWVPSHLYPQSLPIEKVGRDLISKPLIFNENLFIVKNGSITQYD